MHMETNTFYRKFTILEWMNILYIFQLVGFFHLIEDSVFNYQDDKEFWKPKHQNIK